VLNQLASEPSVPGALVVVGTPIGNLGDLSARGAEALRSADAIACEDTRRTGRLLAHLGITPPVLMVANQHTETARTSEILDRLATGQRVALVSDAGMPVVSDPGRRVVAAAALAGHRVEVVPGPVAATSALAVSGLRGDRFVFEGFLPRKGAERAGRLAGIAAEPRTVVLYEAPHRLRRTLGDLVERCGADRPAVVARELTKLHEEVVRGSLAEVADHFERFEPRGELVIMVAGAPLVGEPVDDEVLVAALRAGLDRGLSKRDAVADVVRATGEAKRRVYDLAIGLPGAGR
jgi:16S rRNA (cytidine1402-2'-O)-methyltransferase